MMKLYVNPGSGSACVEAAMSELDMPFERVMVNYSEDYGIDDESYAAVNPRNQIPALILENGECLTETAAILMYLADANPESKLAPVAGTFERAKLNQWMSFVLSNIYEGELRLNYPQRYVHGDPEPVAEAAEEFVMYNYGFIEKAIGDGPYFFGDTLTILDLYIWMFVNWSEDIDSFQQDYPKVIALAEAVMTRPKVEPVQEYNFGPGLGWPMNT